MKKILVLALALCLVFALAACGEDTKPATVNEPANNPASTAPESGSEAEAPEANNDGDAPTAPAAASGSIVSEDGTFTVSTADLFIDVNGTKVAYPYRLDDLSAAGLDTSNLTDLVVSPGGYFTPNIFLDENEDYIVVPNYYNDGENDVPMSEAESGTIGFATYTSEPVDQGVSIFGVKFGDTKADVISRLGEPSYDDGNYVEWELEVSDADLEGNINMYFTSDGDDGLVTDVYLTAVESIW